MRGQQIGQYRLVEEIGAGAYGVVWRAENIHHSDIKAAVKVIRPSLLADPAFVDRLKKESARLVQMDHRGIVRFRDLVLGDDVAAIVMELLVGRDLDADIAGRGPLPIPEVVATIRQVLEALAYAHSNDVVHRDLKPGNLFRCADGRIKVLDFGIAVAATSGSLSQSGTLRGTPRYIAPERFQAGMGGPHSDVYAVGLIAWELLAGRPACAGEDLYAVLGWHMGVGAADVLTVRPGIPAALADVVNGMCAREVSARPKDGAAALARWVAAAAMLSADQASSPPATPPQPPVTGTVEISRAALDEATAKVGPSTVSMARPEAAPTPAAMPPQTVELPRAAVPRPADRGATPPPAAEAAPSPARPEAPVPRPPAPQRSAPAPAATPATPPPSTVGVSQADRDLGREDDDDPSWETAQQGRRPFSPAGIAVAYVAAFVGWVVVVVLAA